MHSIETSYPYRLRGPGLQQSNTGVLWLTPEMRTQGFVHRLSGLALGSFALQNRSGSTGALGIGVRIPNRYWIAGQWDASETDAEFIDDTAAAQDTTATDFELETTTNDDGYVIAARVPFNAISLDIGTASSGGTVARAVSYSNAAGSGWTTLTNLYIQDGAATHLSATGSTAANEALVVFAPPADWGKTRASGLSGMSGGFYALRVQATDAPDTAAVADSVSVCRLYGLTEGIGDLGTTNADYGRKPLEVAWDDVEGYYGDALVALFETADPGNRVLVQVRAL